MLADMVSLWADLDGLEQENRLDFLREPDLGFACAYRWARGLAGRRADRDRPRGR